MGVYQLFTVLLLISFGKSLAIDEKVGDIGEIKIDANVYKVSQFAIDHLTSNSSHGLPCARAWRLDKAHKQTVAGTNYKLTFHLKPHKCSKDALKKFEIPERLCVVTVWERIWQLDNPLTVTEFKCEALSTVSSEKADLRNVKLFKQFVNKYRKNYPSREEYLKRLEIFKENMKIVAKLQETEQGTAVYGATEFADLTKEEFRKNYLGLKPQLRQSNRRVALAETPKGLHFPDSFDWRSYNVVTTVKNQGMCGSCWAFSVTGNVEGQYAIKHKNLLSLSEQELVDCDKLDHGCEGGFMTNAYEQIMSLGGLETESDYPYEGSDDKCSLEPSKVEVKLTSYVNVSTNETEMAQWLAANGPVSIGINANVMQFYFGGVSHPWKFLCSPDDLNHGVLLVGYGVTTTSYLHKTLPYWIVKNSWGSFWGEKGYYRVYRGDGTCGVNLMASSAVVD